MRSPSGSSPSVSAVIPAYNAESFLADAIRSVLAQTYEVVEIIVVDDGSLDRTAEVAAAFPRTRVVRQPNKGQASARNAGIAVAEGEWIAFLDADDLWLPQKTEIQRGYITPDAGVIHADHFDPIHFGNLWHRQTHVSPSGALVRKQTLLDVGGFEESRAVVDDLVLWLKIALTDWRFVRSETGLFTWRSTGENYSGNNSRMVREELASVDLVGSRVNCATTEVERLKQTIRIEYAKNLIAEHRWDEATKLLRDCEPSFAARWLALANALKIHQIARTSIVRRLQDLDRSHGSQDCLGSCNLPEAQRKQCMISCRKQPRQVGEISQNGPEK